jgi:DNA-binding winged helix-turn-helix (wHTH) protein
VKADPARLHDLHMVQSVLALPDHLAVFERGIADRLDFSFAGPQSRRLAELVTSGSVKIGAIHTYLELYARMMVDLTPRVALVVADKADRCGNLYTGPNTEDTPVIVEAAAFSGGVVVAQVNEIVERLPRVDIISFGPFSLDASRRLLTENSTELSARTLGVLIELVCRSNEVVSENDLLARVCPQVTAEEGSLRFHIVGLRWARDDGRDGARYIAILKGRGYCFLAGDRVEEIATVPHFRTLTLGPA